MATQIIETDNRVFEMTLEPDTPGYLKRNLKIRQISGPELLPEQWHRVRENVVRSLIDKGARVVRVTEGE